MEFWNNQILPRLSNVEMIEWFTFAVNALVFLFSKKIASSYGQVKEEAKVRARLRLLHGFNLTVFVTFILSVAIKTDRLLPDEQSLAAVDAKVEATKEVFITAETAAQTAKNNSADDPKSKAEAETKRKEADTARDAYDKLIKNKPVPGKFRFPAAKISQTCLTLLVAYLMIYLAEALLLYRYGREVTVMGYPRRVETSTSRTLELLAYGIIVVCSVVVLVNIWDLTSSLQTTGVIGFLALLIFTTKDYWMRDFLSGILLISSERLGRGDVISIPTENVLGIVLEIRSRQTHVRDLVHGHDIMLPNACLLKNRVDLYKQNPGGPFRDFVDFKISYGAPSEKVQQFLIAVFEKAAESMDSLDREKSARIALKENGNHAARWRLAYILKNPYRLLDVRDAVNLAAYELQDQFELNVSTPTTHVVETRSGNPAKTSSKAEITGSESSS